MGILKYKALNKTNKVVTGILPYSVAAVNIDDMLSAQGLRLIKYEDIQVKPYKKLTSQQLYNVWMSLRHYLLAGFTFVEALQNLVNNTQDARLQALLQSVYDQVCQGRKFSAVLEQYIAEDNIITPLLQTAEQTGNYLDVLFDLEAHAEWKNTFYKDVKNVLTYPAIVFGALWVAMFCIFYFFAPQLQGYLSDLNSDVPMFTRFLLVISNKVVAWPVTWFLFPVYVIAVFKVFLLLFAKAGSALFYIPGIKQIVLKYHYVVIARNLYLYLSNGYTLVAALEHLKKRYAHTIVAYMLNEIFESVSKGVPISASFRRYKTFFSGFFLQMVDVGERSNTLGENFKVISLYYEQDLKRNTTALTRFLEPLTLMIMGGLLVAVIVGLFYPLYSQIGDAVGSSGGL